MADENCGCPESYPTWAGKDVNLVGQCVHRMKIPTFFHMPLAYEAYIKKQAESVMQLGLVEMWPGFTLSRMGMLGGEIMRLLEDSQSPSRLVEYLTPPFTANVALHNGDIGTISKAVQPQQALLIDSARTPKELYLSYLTCPRCAERKGGEKILLLRRWSQSTPSNVGHSKKPIDVAAKKNA